LLDWLRQKWDAVQFEGAFARYEAEQRQAHQSEVNAAYSTATLETEIDELMASITSLADSLFGASLRKAIARTQASGAAVALARTELSLVQRDFQQELAPHLAMQEKFKTLLATAHAERDAAFARFNEAQQSIDWWY